MNTITIMQGDQYPLSVSLELSEGTYPLAADIGDIEVMIGAVRKSLADGDGSYNEGTGVYTFGITQRETFFLSHGVHEVQVRVRSYEGYVIGEDAGKVIVRAARSQEVL